MPCLLTNVATVRHISWEQVPSQWHPCLWFAQVILASLRGRPYWPGLQVRLLWMALAWLVAEGTIFPASSPAAKPLADGIAAIVNTEVITLSELQRELRDERIRLQARFSGAELQRRIQQKEYDVLNRLIERKLQLQEAKALGLTVTDEQVEGALQKLSTNGASALPQPLVRQRLREELLLQRVRDFSIRRHVVVSPREIQAYYKQFSHQFLNPPEYHLRQILFLPRPGESERETKARAQRVFEELRAGAAFAKLAERYSDGPERAHGGDLGYVRREELLAPLAAVLEQLSPGEFSHPIQTRLGIHILALEEVKPPTVKPLEAVREQIHQRLYQQKLDAAYQAWVRELKDKAYIEVKFHSTTPLEVP
ncbi:MAG: hypothetical protein D6704_05585 [Nitrospirae bacterium]|nr:MAG: hypothetical protein D6704_05585 [Nitrospirota bacterium]